MHLSTDLQVFVWHSRDLQAPLDLLVPQVGLTLTLNQSLPDPQARKGQTMDQVLGLAMMNMPRALTLTTVQTVPR